MKNTRMKHGLPSGLRAIESAIQGATPAQQMRLLRRLPRLLKLAPSDLALLKVSKSSFDFWNNPDDVVYDRL